MPLNSQPRSRKPAQRLTETLGRTTWPLVETLVVSLCKVGIVASRRAAFKSSERKYRTGRFLKQRLFLANWARQLNPGLMKVAWHCDGKEISAEEQSEDRIVLSNNEKDSIQNGHLVGRITDHCVLLRIRNDTPSYATCSPDARSIQVKARCQPPHAGALDLVRPHEDRRHLLQSGVPDYRSCWIRHRSPRISCSHQPGRETTPQFRPAMPRKPRPR